MAAALTLLKMNAGSTPEPAPPQIAPAAQAQPATAPPSDSGAVETDAEGLPWDTRIHSSNQKKTGNGNWQKKRNLDPSTYEAVRAEYLGGVTPAAEPNPAQVFGGAAQGPSLFETAAAPVQMTPMDLMTKVTAAFSAKQLTNEQVHAACAANGLAEGLFQISAFPEKIPAIAAALGISA